MRRPPACMDAEEFRLWWNANLRLVIDPVRSPCSDCTPEWHAAMVAASSCDGDPGAVGRPRGGRHSESQRAAWRTTAREYRARQALAVARRQAHNAIGGVSTAPSHEQARRPLTPVEAGPARLSESAR